MNYGIIPASGGPDSFILGLAMGQYHPDMRKGEYQRRKEAKAQKKQLELGANTERQENLQNK